MINKIILFIIFILMLPIIYANGGCIKIADDVFVQLSSAPIAPKVNEQASFLISFGNRQGLITDEINGQLKIVQGEALILTKSFIIKDGILDLKYAFKNAGTHEIFLNFTLANKTYAPEDFVVEVQEEKQSLTFDAILLAIGFIFGIIAMKIIKKK